ncbi:unnamed protein product, partial [Chrysoparadoxa australica]
ESQSAPVYESLIDQLLNPKGNDLSTTVEEFLDMCDAGFLEHLTQRIKDEELVGSDTVPALREVQKEISFAMQRRLVRADTTLREILLLAPDLKAMEGKLRKVFRAGEVDMAFMVMISMNLARAKEAPDAENAVMVLTHLNTVLMEMQDQQVVPEVRLLRMLMRTDCSGVRGELLRQKMVVP